MARSLTGGISPLTTRKLVPVVVGLLLILLAFFFLYLMFRRGNEGFCSSCSDSSGKLS